MGHQSLTVGKTIAFSILSAFWINPPIFLSVFFPLLVLYISGTVLPPPLPQKNYPLLSLQLNCDFDFLIKTYLLWQLKQKLPLVNSFSVLLLAKSLLSSPHKALFSFHTHKHLPVWLASQCFLIVTS